MFSATIYAISWLTLCGMAQQIILYRDKTQLFFTATRRGTRITLITLCTINYKEVKNQQQIVFLNYL